MEFKDYEDDNPQPESFQNKQQQSTKDLQKEDSEELGLDYLKDDEFFNDIFEEKNDEDKQ